MIPYDKEKTQSRRRARAGNIPAIFFLSILIALLGVHSYIMYKQDQQLGDLAMANLSRPINVTADCKYPKSDLKIKFRGVQEVSQ